jgi:hypothetical protein
MGEWKAVLALGLAAVAGTQGCRGAAPRTSAPASALRDATDSSGIDFVHETGPLGTYFMPEVIGSGCALLDYDGDGDLDAYLVNGAPQPGVAPQGTWPHDRLYRQEPDGRFVDVTGESGLEESGFGMGVAVGDIDNDDDLDLYVTNYGSNRLFRNRGHGSFEDVTDLAGVGDPGWSTSAAFFDYDRDGWLDLYVANYLRYDPSSPCADATGTPEYCGPDHYQGESDRLYHNEGDGTFTDVSEESGIGRLARAGLGVVVADLNEDDLLDVYVAEDRHPNTLWVNQGDGTFRDDATLMGAAFNSAGSVEASMGVVCDDLTGDARFDLFLTHLDGESNTAYRNVGPSAFADDTAGMGLLAPSIPYTGFGVVAIDLEHDGDLDLATVNGRVFRGELDPRAEVGPYWNPYAQRAQLFVNTGDGHFSEDVESAPDFTGVPRMGRGLAMGDVDRDGDLDLLATYVNDRARLFLNAHPDPGSWLLVRARDPALRRDAFGARVTVRAGDRQLVRSIHPSFSYLSSSDCRAHFGLGAARAYDGIEVVWPDGTRETFPGGPVDRELTLVRGAGSAS